MNAAESHSEPTPAQLPVGLCIDDKYIVLGPLGQGGCAQVYAAEHAGLARAVAIKVLHVNGATPADWVERFRREARLAAMVRHPNVLEVHDTGSLPDGSPYLVMERITGPSLADLPLPLSLERALELALGLLAGLTAIADAGIVHRDIKPGNLMLHACSDAATLLKIVDFGIAKQVAASWDGTLTNHGSLVGTPRYMAPEQVRGEQADASSDVYAAGAVLYEILTGCAPFESQSLGEQVTAVLHATPKPIRCLRPDCPAALEQIVMKALARERSDRYATAHELLAALRASPRATDSASSASLSADTPRDLATPRDPRTWPLPRLHIGWHAFALLGASVVAFAAWQRPKPAPYARARSAEASMPTLHPPVTVQMSASSPLPVTPESSADARSAAELSTPQRARPPRKVAAKKRSAAHVAAVSTAGDATTPLPVVRPPEAFARAMQSALAAFSTGRVREAEALYAEATRIAPDQPTGYRGHGLALARLGEHERARAAFARYLELAPQADDATRIIARMAQLPAKSAL